MSEHEKKRFLVGILLDVVGGGGLINFFSYNFRPSFALDYLGHTSVTSWQAEIIKLEILSRLKITLIQYFFKERLRRYETYLLTYILTYLLTYSMQQSPS